MRLLFLVLSVACVWVMYVLARDLYDGGRAAGITGAALFVCIPGVIIYATGGPREKTTMMLLLELALLAAVHRRWWWAGVCVALTTLTWQPVFFPALVAVALAAALGQRGTRWRALGSIALGGAVATGLMTAYFVAVGALDDFLDGFVRIHLQYTYQPGLYDDLERQWEGIVEGFDTSLDFVVAGLVLLVRARAARAGAARSPPERARPDARGVRSAPRSSGGLELSGLQRLGRRADARAVRRARPGRPGVARVGVRHLAARRRSWRPRGCWSRDTSARTGPATTRERMLPKQEHEVAAAFAALPDDATVVSVEAPQVLVLTGRTNPTQHQMFRLGLEEYVDDTWPGGLAGYADTIRDEAPTVVAVGPGARYDWLLHGLGDDYTEVGTSPGWYWFARDDLGQETLDALAAAVRG